MAKEDFKYSEEEFKRSFNVGMKSATKRLTQARDNSKTDTEFNKLLLELKIEAAYIFATMAYNDMKAHEVSEDEAFGRIAELVCVCLSIIQAAASEEDRAN